MTLTSNVSSVDEATDILTQFGADLESFGPCDVVVLAPLPEGPDEREIVSTKQLANTPGALTRTADNFCRAEGSAILVLDYDTPYPEHVMSRLLEFAAPNRVMKALTSVAPCFASAARAERASVGGRVRQRSTGKTMNGGLHQYYIVPQGPLIPEAVDRLDDLLMLAGFGFYSVDGAGRLHRKTLIDISASKNAERIIYEAPPDLEHHDLEIDPEAQRVRIFPGGVLDLSKIPPLTPEQESELADVEEREKARVAEEAARIRSDYIAKRVDEQRRAKPAARLDAATFERAIDYREISNDFPLNFDDGTMTTAQDLLDNPERFHEKTLSDPLEPDYHGGRNLAKVYSDKQGIRIFSQAHGGITYRVVHGVEYWFDGEDAPRDLFADSIAPNVLDMPRGCLPLLEPFVRDVSERLGVPEAYVLAPALAVLAGAVGTKLHLQVKQYDDSWRVPAILFVAIVGPPGANKTGAIAQATNPLARIDARKGKEGAERRAQYDERKKSSKRGQPFTEPEPKIERHVTDDSTMEGLGIVLADNPHGVLAVVDELTGWFGSFDSYKPAKGADRALALRLFEGREARVDRVGRRHLYIPSFASSVVGGIQTEKIKELIRQGLDSDGLLQRFIPIKWDGDPRPSIDRPPNKAAIATYETAVAQLAEATFVLPETIQLSPETHEVWRPLAGRLAALAGLPGVGDAWAAHVNKWPGIAARLLLIAHVLDNLGDRLSTVDSTRVTPETAKRTLKLVDWLLGCSLAFYTECVGAGQAGDDARWIAGYILSRAKAGKITRRDIGQARRELRDDHQRLVQAMRFLEAANWCVADDEERTDKFGPSRWTICPAVHDGRFSSRANGEAVRRSREREKIAAAAAERRRLLGETVHAH